MSDERLSALPYIAALIRVTERVGLDAAKAEPLMDRIERLIEREEAQTRTPTLRELIDASRVRRPRNRVEDAGDERVAQERVKTK